MEPVPYSATISGHPGVAGFKLICSLVPARRAPDYSQLNVVFLHIQANAGGTIGNFCYKTTEPNGKQLPL